MNLEQTGFLNNDAYLPGDEDDRSDESHLPDQLTVSTTYEDDGGRSYSDQFPLSIDVLGEQTGTYPATSGEDGERRRLVNAVERIARNIGRH